MLARIFLYETLRTGKLASSYIFSIRSTRGTLAPALKDRRFQADVQVMFGGVRTMFSRAFVPSYGVKHASGDDPVAEIEVKATESRREMQKRWSISAVLLL
jgi:hypothetical protein